MRQFAQTNLQLMNELRGDGYADTALTSVVNSYELAMHLFTGRFRPSGKTFIAHLVGTASILASLRVSADLVAAGLIHAAYTAGDFGDNAQGITETRRAHVQRVVGVAVEEYVARYTALPWTPERAPVGFETLHTLGAADRDVLLMRLANELEDYLDLGILYRGHDPRLESSPRHDYELRLIQLAEKLGFPSLASDLTEAFERVAVADLPLIFRRPPAQSRSFLLAPRSHQRLVEAVAKRLTATESNR